MFFYDAQSGINRRYIIKVCFIPNIFLFNSKMENIKGKCSILARECIFLKKINR
jgi:Fe-S-cluster containining protein